MKALLTINRLLSPGTVSHVKARHLRTAVPLTLLLTLFQCAPSTRAAQGDGVALAIVYDTSGSMQDVVPDANGRRAPKHVIAKRALEATLARLQRFATNSAGGTRAIEAGIFTFRGQGAFATVRFGPFDAREAAGWSGRLPSPRGGTPLGNAVRTAGDAVLHSKLPRKHVLVITDGLNTVGPDPSVILPRLQNEAAQKGAGLSVHFVAFDVDEKRFDAVKKLGATVVGAADEAQLNNQLTYILEKKILLEDEEEPTRK